MRFVPAEVSVSIDTALTISILALARALVVTRERLARLEAFEELRRHQETVQPIDASAEEGVQSIPETEGPSDGHPGGD